jgi:hypothetical protein
MQVQQQRLRERRAAPLEHMDLQALIMCGKRQAQWRGR